ncbi:MAG: thiamine diphosphokinase [Pseudomonadota bacterium]
MTSGNVQSSRGVTLVGGGAPRAEDIKLLRGYAPDLVAADGGANFCAAEGLSPVAVIGDFDSLAPETKEKLTKSHFIHVAEQDSTDFYKCLTNIQAPFILATGFTAKRLDHTLAALSTLVQIQTCPVILLGEEDVIFAAPKRLELPLPAGQRLSLFPMAPVKGRSTGLKWAIDGLELSPNGRIGTSNETLGPVTLEFEAGGCLVILPRTMLEVALMALTG